MEDWEYPNSSSSTIHIFWAITFLSAINLTGEGTAEWELRRAKGSKEGPRPGKDTRKAAAAALLCTIKKRLSIQSPNKLNRLEGPDMIWLSRTSDTIIYSNLIQTKSFKFASLLSLHVHSDYGIEWFLGERDVWEEIVLLIKYSIFNQFNCQLLSIAR